MSRPIFIALLACAMASCSTAPDYARPNFVDQLPAPIAVEGEPPIITKKVGSQGSWKVYSQTFPDAGTFVVTLPRGDIASRYYAFQGRTEDLPATEVSVKCNITHGGSVSLSSCSPAETLNDDQNLAFSILRYRSDGVDFPRFRALPDDRESISRSVLLTLAVPSIPAPRVDLASGPLVEPKLIDMKLDPNSIADGYPSRALRQEIEGNLLVECQVQTDLSLICTPLTFDPPEHFEIFKNAPRRAFRSTRAEPLLKDGSDARGVRWRSTMAFRIPQ